MVELFKEMPSKTIDADGMGVTIFGTAEDVSQEDVEAVWQFGSTVVPLLFEIAARHPEDFEDPDVYNIVKETWDELKEMESGE